LEHLFKEVQVDKIADKIVDQLENLIKEGQLAPGNKLPSERQLIDMLGVGRSSLKEALNKLEVMGYVEIKTRKGIYVKSIDSTLQLDPMRRIIQKDKNSIVQLYEIRSDIEQASAYAAAMQRNERDLEKIHTCFQDFESPKGLLHFNWDRDLAFHSSIARASHNFFRIHVIMNIFDLSKEFIKPIMEGFANTQEKVSTIFRQHVSIFEAIESKRADDAEETMKEHLDWTNQQLIEYFDEALEVTS